MACSSRPRPGRAGRPSARSGERMPWTGHRAEGEADDRGTGGPGSAAGRKPAANTPGGGGRRGRFFCVPDRSAGAAQACYPGPARDAGAWLTEPGRRTAVAIALNLVPFAGIAFLWFIGVLRDRIGEREDRFFATVFLGSSLLFVGMLFVAAAVSGGLIAAASQPSGPPGAGTLALGRDITTTLLNV